MVGKAKRTAVGTERMRDDDFAKMQGVIDARDDAIDVKNRAEIAYQSALQDFNEFNRRMIKKYKLTPRDGVQPDGSILRNTPPPVVQG